MFDLFKNKIHVGLWIIILLSIFSCKKEPGPIGMVYGKVYFAGTTVPVINMAVAVDDFSDTTNERGYFRIDNIPIGSYNLVTYKKDFTAFESDISISTVATELNIETSSELFTSAVSGEVVGDKTLEPKAEVRIIILNPNGTESKLQATSDENGKYEINNIPQGDRTLILKSGSFEFLRVTINLQSWDYFLDFNYPEVDVPLEFTDHRDGNVYLSMEIGNQTWMLENLKYLPAVHSPREESSTDPMYYVYWYKGNDVSEAKDSMYYDLFGVAYNWPAALNACPSGWHLPTDDEWNELQIYLGMNPSEEEVYGYQISGNVGYKLKSKEGWEDCWNGTELRGDNGNNSSHMNIKPGGGKMDKRSFYLPDGAHMWTSTQFDSKRAWLRSLGADKTSVYRIYNTKLHGHFIRCVKDY